MPSRYEWDSSARRYRGPSGQFIASGRALASLETDILNLRSVTDLLADDLRARRMSLVEWRLEMQTVIKHTHLGAAELAMGGRAQMTPADYGRVGQIVREQYGFLEGWVQEIVSGSAPLDGRLGQRARLYVAAARPTYVTIRTHDLRESGFDQERSILTDAEHCGECVSEDAKGWQPIGDMISIGSRTCRVLDKCRAELRNSRTGEVQAA